MIRAAILGLVLAATPLAATTQEVTEFRLDNGMEVVVIEDHRSPAVTHMVWYRVGAADEPWGQSGIAHYLEHLMFKGTETREDGEFSRLVAANGGTDNAFTSQDYTGYFQRVAADRLGLMMELEADRMANLSLTPEQAAPELDVVLEERAQRVDGDPGSLFREQSQAALYLNHPYGVPIIGWRDEIAALTLDDAMDFYDRHYAPNNAILVVAGDVEPQEVRRLAEEHYGAIPARDDLQARQRPAEPPHRAERRLVFEDPRIAEPIVTRTYLAPERDPGAQERAAALVYLSDLMGGDPQTSVLGRRLVIDQSLATYVSAYYQPTSLDDTIFGVWALPRQGVGLDEMERALDEAIAAFLEEGVDSERMERLRRQYAASEIYARDAADGLARRYGAALTSGLTVDDVQAWPEILQEVTEEDVMTAARELFDRDRAVTGWLRRPEDSSATRSDAEASGADVTAEEAIQ